MPVTTTTIACPICGSEANLLPRYLPARLQGCGHCGLAFQDAASSNELRARYNEEYFATYGDGRTVYGSDDRGRRHQARVRLRFMAGHARPPGTLLEFGAAGGHFLDEARRAGYEAFGVEPEPGMAAVARRTAGVPVAVAFLEDLDLASQRRDVVCGWHVLEHIPDPVAALRHVRSALRPGGHFFVEVPNFEGAEAMCRGLNWAYLDLPHHVSQFGPRSLAAAAERAGLEVVHLETVAMFRYFRPSVAVRPLRLVRRARLSLRARAPLRNTHPSKHDLLRLVARRPA